MDEDPHLYADSCATSHMTLDLDILHLISTYYDNMKAYKLIFHYTLDQSFLNKVIFFMVPELKKKLLFIA